MEATKLLKMDHRRVKLLFERYDALGDRAMESRQKIFDQLYAELDVHTKIEEELFYPRARSLRSEELHELVAESIQEHIVIRTLLSDLKGLSPEVEEFDAKMSVLKENVLHHAVEEEEAKFFPLFNAEVSLEEREELGRKLEARKDSLQKGWIGAAAEWLRTLIPQSE